MSICSTEPANQICYIEPPPKPLGSAVKDFIKEQIKTQETARSQHGTTASVANVSAAPIATVNAIGQVTGQIISTTA
jgi:hypothetical protein